MSRGLVQAMNKQDSQGLKGQRPSWTERIRFTFRIYNFLKQRKNPAIEKNKGRFRTGIRSSRKPKIKSSNPIQVWFLFGKQSQQKQMRRERIFQSIPMEIKTIRERARTRRALPPDPTGSTKQSISISI